MVALAAATAVALRFITAPYGIAYRPGWGPALSNRAGWVLMEAPAFAVMLLITLSSLIPALSSLIPALSSPHRPLSTHIAAYAAALLYLAHYFRRSFIFPLRMRGRSRMPLLIALMGALFNTVNAYLIGGWLFHIAAGAYPAAWLSSWQFAAGTIIFLAGMWINVSSDGVVRRLRAPGDTAHHIPRAGMFRYVSAASYLGEIVEWGGFALLTWSPPGAVFLLWTCANLVPRATRLHRRYLDEFGDEYARLRRRIIFPFIY